MATFTGFAAFTDKGTPVWVINEGLLNDQTPAYKVRLGRYNGVTGWNGGSKTQYAYDGRVGWIAKSKIKK